MRYLPWVLLLVLTWSLGGCRLPSVFRSADLPTQPSPAVMKKYNAALDAFNAGDYVQAGEIFDALRLETTDKTMARMALYGLACAKLMTADTPEAYVRAVSLWESWLSTAPGRMEHENPALLAPLVKEKMLFSNVTLTQTSEDSTEPQKDAVPRWLLIRSTQELEKAKAKLEDAEKHAKQSQKKINTLEKELEKLREQIKALETIDQKIHKKKSAIPSAD